jgi:cyclase
VIKRLSALVVLDKDLVVNSYNFLEHLPVGKLKHTLKRLQDFEIDEVIILNTSHSVNAVDDFNKVFMDIDSWHFATPLAYGGGITCVKDAVEIIKAGAERVVISPKLLLESFVFLELCNYLGDQAVILHLPLEFDGNAITVRGINSMNLESILNHLPDHWGGEIMLTCVESDGAKFPNWKSLSSVLQIVSKSRNIILAGGFSTPKDISKGLLFDQVSAVASGNFLHRIELSVVNLKKNVDTSIKLRRKSEK